MKLVFIYGVPAVGKLTVANALAEKTSFKVFHNHLTIELGVSLFPQMSPEYNKLIDAVRWDCIEAAAKENVSFIFTFVFSSMDRDFVEEVLARVHKHDGEVCFVHLTADISEIEKRIQNDSRKEYSKISSMEKLNAILSTKDFTQDVPFKNNLTVDTTHLLPEETAQKIVEHFNL